MQDFVALLNQYVRSEQLVVVPVLYILAKIRQARYRIGRFHRSF